METMEQVSRQVSLSEIREGAVSARQDVLFKKRLLGGYDPKEVSDYVNALKDSLHRAERSFQERLEEYAAASAMVSQERDKYLKALKEGEEKQDGLLQKVAELSRRNVELIAQTEELSKNVLSGSDLQEYEQTLARNSAMNALIKELENKLDEAEHFQYDIIKLQSEKDQLESMLTEMRARIEEYEKNKVLAEQYEAVVSENNIIKERSEHVMAENSRALADRNVLADQNARLSEALARLYEENKRLRAQYTDIKLKARSIKGKFEARVIECTENHKQNIEQINENLKSALRLVSYEQLDVDKLLDGFEDELDFESRTASGKQEDALNLVLNQADEELQ